MDTVVVNTVGLIGLLELKHGVHYEDIPANERLAFYYDALGKYMKDNPTNVLSASFKLSGLSTAEAVLAWRDELRHAGWDLGGSGISSRIDAIIGAEKYFMEVVDKHSGKTKYLEIIDRVTNMIDVIRQNRTSCSGIKLSLPCTKELLHPMERKLVTVMEECGAIVEIQPSAADNDNNLCTLRRMISDNGKEKMLLRHKGKDSSLLIWKFPDETAANEYLAYYSMDDVDVWINADNKQMDNWLHLIKKPQTGSTMNNCCPQLVQMLVLGIGLFDSQLNVNTLLEWLNMPVHPLNAFFRKVLADAIVGEGGYKNATCSGIIQDYIEGKYVYLDEVQRELSADEQEKIRRKDRKKRDRYAALFLPSIGPQDAFVSQTLKDFAAEISAWSRQQAHLMSENSGNTMWSEQLLNVASMADALFLLINSTDSDRIDNKMISSWMSTIYKKSSFTNTVPEKGCRIVTDSPGKLVSTSCKTV